MYVFVHACSNRNLMISSVAFRRPGESYLDCALGEILEIFPPSQKNCFLSLKISDDLFFALFTQLTNETPHFAPLSQIVLLQKCLFFRPLYAIFTTIFVNYYEKALKIFLGHRFCAP